ncbi:MAG: hypothetical protein F9K30_16895 [Dechloromonas sp.]|nr:MAG: hypothetical protein F9K30_16895 [Dechloromonas sp.]
MSLETREWSDEMQDDARLTLFDALPTKPNLRAQIDRLSLSADAKAVLNDILEVVIEVGGRVISVGREILTFVLDMMQRYPNTAFGLVVALVISTLIASIPLLGVVLGPLMAPLFIAFGLAAGALADLKDGPLRARVAQLEKYYEGATKNA